MASIFRVPRTLVITILFGVLLFQCLRYLIIERTLTDVESGRVRTFKHVSVTGDFLKVYVRPLGVFGYFVFDNEVFVVDSRGNRFVRVCNFYNEQRFHSRLDYLTTRKDSSFEDLYGDSILCQMARWRSYHCLFPLDLLFVTILCSIFYQIAFCYQNWVASHRGHLVVL